MRFYIGHMCIYKMADSNLVSYCTVAVEVELRRYRHKVQRRREKRLKHLREMRRARYRWFLMMKRQFTLSDKTEA